jgi:chemotaxis family two-component system response regulator Rcp1
LRLHLQNCIILHAEDDDSSAFLFRLVLDQAGITASVYRVSDGEQALLFLRKHPPYAEARTPQIAIVDLNMPKVNGWELLSTRQTDTVLQPIPFIVMSTAPASKNAAKALRSGAQHYIEKSANLDELVEQVQGYCNLYLK